MIDPSDLFLPKAAIRNSHLELFEGRKKLISSAVEAISVAGAAMVLYGDRGVGKTSLAWQIMRILQGDLSIARSLGIRLAFTPPPRKCVWLQCNRSMRDIEDMLISLMLSRTEAPCLRDLFPDAYSSNRDRRLKDLRVRNLRSDPEAEAERKSGAWAFEVREAFNELLLQIRRLYRLPEIIIFLDEFDTMSRRLSEPSIVQNDGDDLLPHGSSSRPPRQRPTTGPLGLGDLIKTSEGARFVIIGVADDIGELIIDHPSINRKLANSTFKIPGLLPEDFERMFDKTESLAPPGYLSFERGFRDLVIEQSDGIPWLFHLIGHVGVLQCLHDVNEDKRRFPLSLGREEFDRAVDDVLSPGAAAGVTDDPYRSDNLSKACRGSSSRETVLYSLARSPSGWVPEEPIRKESSLSERAARDALKRLSEEFGILQSRIDPRSSRMEYRFADPIMRLFVRLAAHRGKGTLAGGSRA
ncbi:MAG: AAA family ATPase [Isosphaeraceae bacterium]|nr:AAA family ATPase [Isosphaeraceae bacterium]